MKPSKKKPPIYISILKLLANERAFSPRSIAQWTRKQNLLDEHVYRYRRNKKGEGNKKPPTDKELDSAVNRLTTTLSNYRSRLFPKEWKEQGRVSGQFAYFGWQWKTILPDEYWCQEEQEERMAVLAYREEYERKHPPQRQARPSRSPLLQPFSSPSTTVRTLRGSIFGWILFGVVFILAMTLVLV